MRILERVCRECGEILPEIEDNLRINQENFIITGVVRQCTQGHLQPCDIEE